jgi:hypothetical protein
VNLAALPRERGREGPLWINRRRGKLAKAARNKLELTGHLDDE